MKRVSACIHSIITKNIFLKSTLVAELENIFKIFLAVRSHMTHVAFQKFLITQSVADCLLRTTPKNDADEYFKHFLSLSKFMNFANYFAVLFV